jgi:opacity protein-like surface antigen
MRTLVIGFLCLAAASAPLLEPSLRAQDEPRLNVFGGYSYANVDTNGLTASRQSANGWEASLSGDFNRWLAAEGDLSGYYKTYSFLVSGFGLPALSANVNDFAVMGGPRVNLQPAFFHVLLGFDRLTGSALGSSASQNSFAAGFGGGVQIPVTPHLALRASGDYITTHHNLTFVPGTSYTQSNFRLSVGIVFKIGGTHENLARIATQNPQPRTSQGEDAPLLGVRVYERRDRGGVVVAAVRDPSPAAGAGIKVGDVIMSIDNQAVQSGHDIESAVAANKTGTVRLMYFESGVVQSFKDIKIH